jgi:hypothetical protein
LAGAFPATTRASDAISVVGLTAGWATFGVAPPRGCAFSGLRVAELPTQTDVKCWWPDGSIKYAVVTAFAPEAGAYEIFEGTDEGEAFSPAVPFTIIRFTSADDVFSTMLPEVIAGVDWLAGPLVVESRISAAPCGSDGLPHPFLNVLIDLRSYIDGQSRLDVTVENTLDTAAATATTYDIEVEVDGNLLFARTGVTHPYLTRWRRVFEIGPPLSHVTVDFEPAFRAGALPRYLDLVADIPDSANGPNYDILGPGALNPYMPSHGGRPEIAPYPDWAARYIVHRDADRAQFVRISGDLAGSWPVHLREPAEGPYAGIGTGRMVSIDERPNFWLDSRAEPGDRPAGDLGARGPLEPDNAHQPSLAYVPYLISGDRYYADEMAFWANYVLLVTFQDATYNGRGGALGLLYGNEVRGIAWGLRNLADAAAYLPDAEPAKWYFAEKVDNNLRWLDSYADSHQTPCGTLWEDKRPENHELAPKVWIAPWEQNYLAWAIDHANRLGFAGGERHRDHIAQFQLALFLNEPEYQRGYAAPYILAVADRDEFGQIEYYQSFGQCFSQTFGDGGSTENQFAGYYGVDARLMLMIAVEQDWQGSLDAYDYLWPFIGVQPFFGDYPDLAVRAGWATALAG